MKNLLNNPLIQKILAKLKLNDKKTILIIVSSLIIIIYLDLTFLINKQLGSIKNLGPKIGKLKKDLDTLEKDLFRIQDIQNKQAQTKQKIISKVKKIITNEEKTACLQDISDLANKNKVKIIQIKFSSESESQKEVKVSSMENLTPLLITLDLSCDYHQMGAFINDLENAQIFIAVQNMKITSQTEDFLKQEVILALKTYVKK